MWLEGHSPAWRNLDGSAGHSQLSQDQQRTAFSLASEGVMTPIAAPQRVRLAGVAL